jgi:purine nucleosidase
MGIIFLMIPIFLDTDIGDDIDDALALTVAINSPEVELRGVTTVFRDAPRRTLLARQLLDLSGHGDIPVYAGCSRPLLQRYEDIPGGSHVGRQFETVDSELKAEPEITAIGALRQAVLDASQKGEKLTIVAIGPLTNIAMLLHMAPEVVPLCRVVLMGGKWDAATTGPIAEWNIFCDPEAAAMVFRSGVEIKMVGLDVTLRCVLNTTQVAAFREANTPLSLLLHDLIQLWGHRVTLHDPLTMLTLFDDCVRFERKHIEVGLNGETRGSTYLHHGRPNCSVAVDVDVERAVALFMERVLA